MVFEHLLKLHSLVLLHLVPVEVIIVVSLPMVCLEHTWLARVNHSFHQLAVTVIAGFHKLTVYLNLFLLHRYLFISDLFR